MVLSIQEGLLGKGGGKVEGELKSFVGILGGELWERGLVRVELKCDGI